MLTFGLVFVSTFVCGVHSCCHCFGSYKSILVEYNC